MQIEPFPSGVRGDKYKFFGTGELCKDMVALCGRQFPCELATFTGVTLFLLQSLYHSLNCVGVFAEKNHLIVGVCIVNGFQMADERCHLGFGNRSASIQQGLQLAEFLYFVLSPPELGAKTPHDCKIAAVRITLESGEGFIGQRLPTTYGTEMFSLDFNVLDFLTEVEASLLQCLCQRLAGRGRSFPEDCGHQADCFSIGTSARLLSERVEFPSV